MQISHGCAWTGSSCLGSIYLLFLSRNVQYWVLTTEFSVPYFLVICCAVIWSDRKSCASQAAALCGKFENTQHKKCISLTSCGDSIINPIQSNWDDFEFPVTFNACIVHYNWLKQVHTLKLLSIFCGGLRTIKRLSNHCIWTNGGILWS